MNINWQTSWSEHDLEQVPVVKMKGPFEVMRIASEACECGVYVIVATVLVRRGSAPSTPGQKLVLLETKECFGTIGGGAIERDVLIKMVQMMISYRETPHLYSTLETYKLGSSLGMCCGGSVDILIESMVPQVSTLLIGAGHVGCATAQLLSRCGFAVILVDEREGWFEHRAFDSRIQCISGEFMSAAHLVSRRSIVIAMTHDHQLDQKVIEWALRERFDFVGGVGSRAKLARTVARLEAKGFSELDITRIRMPVGLTIGARTPDEIAVSIAAELIAWVRKK